MNALFEGFEPLHRSILSNPNCLLFLPWGCRVKSKLHEMMRTDKNLTPEDEASLNPSGQISISNALKFIQNPFRCCKHVHGLIKELNKIIASKQAEKCNEGIYEYRIYIIFIICIFLYI